MKSILKWSSKAKNFVVNEVKAIAERVKDQDSKEMIFLVGNMVESLME